MKKSTISGTLDPVHASTTSCIVQGVANSINPNDSAVIVFDVLALNFFS